MIKTSAVLLSLSVVLKPISFPLLGLPILFSQGKSWKKTIQYSLIVILVIVSLWILPFNLLGWALPSSGVQVTSYFMRAGGMTPFNIIEILQDTTTFPAGLYFLGYLWIPALLAGYYLVYRDPPKNFNELTQKAIGLMLIFFLTYSWLSEPYVIIVIALALLALPYSKTSFRDFHFLWVLPLVFMVFSTNFAQLFYLVSPQSLVSGALAIENNIREWRLILCFIVVVVWQVFAWRLVVKLLGKKSKSWQ